MVPAELRQAEAVHREGDVLPPPGSQTAPRGLQGKVLNGQIGQERDFLVLDLRSPLLKMDDRIRVRLDSNQHIKPGLIYGRTLSQLPWLQLIVRPGSQSSKLLLMITCSPVL